MCKRVYENLMKISIKYESLFLIIDLINENQASVCLSLSQWPLSGRSAAEALIRRNIHHPGDASRAGGGGAGHVRQGKSLSFYHSPVNQSVRECHRALFSVYQSTCSEMTGLYRLIWRTQGLSGCFRLTDSLLWSYVFCRRCHTLSSCTPLTLWTVTSPLWISLYPCPIPETASLTVSLPLASTAPSVWTWVCHTLINTYTQTTTSRLVRTSHSHLLYCCRLTLTLPITYTSLALFGITWPI